MKAKTLIILLIGVLSIPTSLRAQQCLGVAIKEGTGYEVLTYDGRGKETGKLIYNIKKVTQEGGKTMVDVELETFDKRKSVMANTFQLTCDGKEMRMDTRMAMGGQQSEAYGEMKMNFTSTDLIYPSDLSVGQTLPDGSLHGEGSMGAMVFTMDTQMKNRKVEAREQVTVPAGTFDAYKVTTDMQFDMKAGIKSSSTMQLISYRTNDVLFDIKSETYRNGKLITSSVLSKIIK